MSSPDPQANISARVHYKTFLSDSVSVYEKLMSGVSDRKTPPLTDLELTQEHEQAIKTAINCFRGKARFGDEELSAKYEREVEKEVNKKFEDYKTLNDKHRNELEEEEIARVEKEQELDEKEKTELEEALKKIQEENLQLLRDSRNDGRDEVPGLKEALKEIQEQKVQSCDNGDDRVDGEGPQNKPIWTRIRENIEYYYYPSARAILLISFAVSFIRVLKNR